MNSWLLRGVIMSAAHIVTRVVLGILMVNAPLHGTVWKTVGVAIVVFIAIIGGGIDGLRDAQAHEDPDDYEDLTIRWLRAGLFAGWVAGLVCWLLGKFVFAGIGEASFWIEMTAGAFFTALIIFIPAFAGASVGRMLVRRQQRKSQPPSDDSDAGGARFADARVSH
ncbi:B-4DMT family transporter [Gordonia sp. TBRC 11910]|uniref:B-4DMT family transporter n=1 Tax=Gordonia asplenii TaxID=2725283 RepID=A0A848KMY0_9ACTN|nr:B-4DMT family transporter [Gordonia asplenii]NMO00424.1 B-4DMT family transporter [Gordonia asplenii]